jgi:polar amino acid transport system permease protein
VIRNFGLVLGHWQDLAIGFLNTIWLSGVSAALSLALAALLTLPLMARRRMPRTCARLLVDGIRCIPFLLFAYLVYYCLPVVGIRLTNWTAGLVTLVIYNTAYFAEVLRGAWSHLPHEQEESGRAFGYSGMRLFVRIIAPQVVLAAAPVLGNQSIILIKDTAFLMIITVPELTYAANHIQSTYFVAFETFMVAVVLYWVLCTTVQMLVRRLERVAEVTRYA